jgi:hypothetical protein
VYYDNNNKTDLFEKLDFYRTNVEKSRRVAVAGYLHSMKYHRAAALFDYVFRTMEVKRAVLKKKGWNRLQGEFKYADTKADDIPDYAETGYDIRQIAIDFRDKKRPSIFPTAEERAAAAAAIISAAPESTARQQPAKTKASPIAAAESRGKSSADVSTSAVEKKLATEAVSAKAAAAALAGKPAKASTPAGATVGGSQVTSIDSNSALTQTPAMGQAQGQMSMKEMMEVNAQLMKKYAALEQRVKELEAVAAASSVATISANMANANKAETRSGWWGKRKRQ